MVWCGRLYQIPLMTLLELLQGKSQSLANQMVSFSVLCPLLGCHTLMAMSLISWEMNAVDLRLDFYNNNKPYKLQLFHCFIHQYKFKLACSGRWIIHCIMQLEVLSNGNSLHEVAHIANGSHPGNCISLLRINVSISFFLELWLLFYRLQATNGGGKFLQWVKLGTN